MVESIVLTVTGMKCGGCESNVVEKLSSLEGIAQVSDSSKENTVSIEFDAEKIDLSTIQRTISDAGFAVNLE